MFGVDTTELLLIAVIALLFIGPKDLPQAMRTAGQWIGKVRGMARHFTSGLETMVREAELEEMEKQWRAENDRIMREFPALTADAAADPAADAKAYLGDTPPAQDPDPAAAPAPYQAEIPAPSEPEIHVPAAPDDDPRPRAERELP
jgi:sec-independent protein translocase protein TatB